MRVFFVRHQAAGLLHMYPFVAQPTEKQLATLAQLCTARCGANDDGWWMQVVSVDSVGIELPVVLKGRADGEVIAQYDPARVLKWG